MIVCGNIWHVGRFRFDRPTPAFETIDIENADHMADAGDNCR
jgi:hypothetical protein